MSSKKILFSLCLMFTLIFINSNSNFNFNINAYALTSSEDIEKLINEDKTRDKNIAKKKAIKDYKQQKFDDLYNKLQELKSECLEEDNEYKDGLRKEYIAIQKERFYAEEALKENSKISGCDWYSWTKEVDKEKCEKYKADKVKFNEVLKATKERYNGIKSSLDAYSNKTAMLRARIKDTESNLRILDRELNSLKPKPVVAAAPRDRNDRDRRHTKVAKKSHAPTKSSSSPRTSSADDDEGEEILAAEAEDTSTDASSSSDDDGGGPSAASLKAKHKSGSRKGKASPSDTRKMEAVTEKVRVARQEATDLLVKVLEHTSEIQSEQQKVGEKLNEISKELDKSYLGMYMDKKMEESNGQIVQAVGSQMQMFGQALQAMSKKIQEIEKNCKCATAATTTTKPPVLDPQAALHGADGGGTRCATGTCQ
ncbi:MAG: hypothetical protein HQK51_05680 [Oligoflexia bacterium]|nr:hypothetical protein [Oligoflexia bacterium]